MSANATGPKLRQRLPGRPIHTARLGVFGPVRCQVLPSGSWRMKEVTSRLPGRGLGRLVRGAYRAEHSGAELPA